jgi:soluble lytic murein transglycosylase
LTALPDPARASDGAPPLTRWLEGVAESAQALADGDAAGAERAARDALTAIPTGAPAARAGLGLGLALQRQERFGDAAAVLERAEPRLVEADLLAAARLARARSLLGGGDPAGAAALFREVEARGAGTLSREARWREADALLAAGQPAAAEQRLQQLIAREPRAREIPAARLGLAIAARASGDAPRAVALYRALWIDLPAEPAGIEAERALRAWRDAGGPVPDPTPNEWLARAARFLQLALPRRAIGALDELDATRPGGEPATRSTLFRALALLQLGRRDEARDLAVPLRGAAAAEPGTRLGAELVLARAAARSGRVDEAAARYRTLAGSRERIPGLPASTARDLPDEARFLAAWLYYDAGRFERAVALLRAYARAHPGSRRADDARWFAAWSLHRLGRRGEAMRALAALSRGPLSARALYWQARLHRPGEAQRALYRRVLQAAPLSSWYGVLSASALAAAGEPPAPPAAVPPGDVLPDGPGAEGSDPLVRAAQLLGAGLREAALEELRSMAEGREQRRRAPLVAQLAAAAGDAELPFRIARDHLPPSRRALRWLYPEAFPELLPDAASSAGCDPQLVRAVMRRESAFRPDARSGAGALGLLQLIPPTAERLAVIHGIAGEPDLRDPADGVPLGTAYLGLLQSRFRDEAIVLAAYNGGPPAVARWARERAGRPLDEWVEDIPFRETRGYVKAVTADALVYRSLWEGQPLRLDPRRPMPAPREGVAF